MFQWLQRFDKISEWVVLCFFSQQWLKPLSNLEGDPI